jgi:hypothetical protein
MKTNINLVRKLTGVPREDIRIHLKRRPIRVLLTEFEAHHEEQKNKGYPD